MASRASLSRSLGTACLNPVVVLLFGTLFVRKHWIGKNWREHDCGGGGGGVGEAMKRDAQAWIELCVEEFAIPRTCAARCSPLSEG